MSKILWPTSHNIMTVFTQYYDRLLTILWPTSHNIMTDFSQYYDRLHTILWPTSHNVMTDFSQYYDRLLTILWPTSHNIMTDLSQYLDPQTISSKITIKQNNWRTWNISTIRIAWYKWCKMNTWNKILCGHSNNNIHQEENWLTLKQKTSKVLHLEQNCLWFWNLDS
jgi:preprotein translocase subunit SecE